MTLTPKADLVGKMTLDRFPQADVRREDWAPVAGPNYLVALGHLPTFDFTGRTTAAF
jgi:hypothetical protein